MKKLYTYLLAIIIVMFLSPLSLHAQTEITLEECIKRALETNYAIRRSYNEVKQLDNNLNYSPFLPKVEMNAAQNQKITDTKSEVESMVEKHSGRVTDGISMGVGLNWRLFDGLSMFVTQTRYEEMLKVGELTLLSDIENLIMEVCSFYYNVIKQQSKLKASKHTLELSAERYKEANDKYMLGVLSRLELQQAKLDFNADSSSFMQQKEYLKSAYISLNEVMNRELQQTITVHDSIVLKPLMRLAELNQKMLTQNTTLLIGKKEKVITQLDFRNARAALYPTLDFTSGYNYNRNSYSSGTASLNRSNGTYWGFSVQMNLFNRLDNRKKVKNAKLDIENSELSFQEAEWMLKAELAQLYNKYENNLQIVTFEKENVLVAFDNLDAALEKYRLGSLSGIEFRESQRSYIEAVDREVTALYQAKISELALLLISGEIRVAKL